MRFLIYSFAICLLVLNSAVISDAETTTEPPLPTPKLTFSNQDLDIKIDDSETVTLTLSPAPTECFNITFSVEKNITEDVPSIICMEDCGNCETEWNITITATDNGKTIFRAQAHTAQDDSINSKDAFIRLSVMINPNINTVGDVMGWIYTIAWDISFLPQIYRNWRRKSVVGLAFDFLTFNFIGFFSYLMYNIGNLWIPTIEEEFLARHPTSVMHVRLNDVMFPLYALVCTALQIVQCFIYEREPGQRVSMTCRIISGLLVLSEIIVLIIAASSETLEWLDLLLWFSYVKLIITCVKYIPQLYMNYKVKSTEGWSIWQVILDCTGGTLSLCQMFMLATNYNDWYSVLTDPAKLGLGLLSIFFNIFFFMQHYCIYRGAKINRPNEEDLKSFEGVEKLPPSRKSSTTKSNNSLKGFVNPDPEAHM